MSLPHDTYDGPWKDAITEYLADCLALLFPVVFAEIDWSRAPIFLDTELQQAARDASTGPRHIDRLVQVWLRDGHDAWLLIHIEVQSQRERAFPKRMFVYYYRILDYHDHEVVGLAILADTYPTWRPDAYTFTRWGCELRYRYPVAKLADWRHRLADLEASENPFATVLLAHLAAQDTRQDPVAREQVKLGLVRRLYARGYDRERVVSLFRFIDWLLALPTEAERRIRQVIETIEEEQPMAYVTSIERMAREEGREEGRQEGLLAGQEAGQEAGRLAAKREDLRQILQARFGIVPLALEEQIAEADEAFLSALLLRAVTVSGVDDL